MRIETILKACSISIAKEDDEVNYNLIDYLLPLR